MHIWSRILRSHYRDPSQIRMLSRMQFKKEISAKVRTVREEWSARYCNNELMTDCVRLMCGAFEGMKDHQNPVGFL